MLRRFLALLTLAVLAVTLGTSSVSLAAPSTTIEFHIGEKEARVNGVSVTLDTAPVIPEGESRTYVPVRFIGEQLGAYIGWDGNEEKVTYLTGDLRIELWIGKREARVNGSKVTLDAAPFIDENSRTLVPVRFVSEQMGATVEWEGSMQMVTIRAPWSGRVVLIEDSQFTPDPLVIEAGTRVTWVNLDTVLHNVVGSGWNSPLLSREQAYTRTFDAAGTENYSCTLHPNMDARLVVR